MQNIVISRKRVHDVGKVAVPPFFLLALCFLSHFSCRNKHYKSNGRRKGGLIKNFSFLFWFFYLSTLQDLLKGLRSPIKKTWIFLLVYLEALFDFGIDARIP